MGSSASRELAASQGGGGGGSTQPPPPRSSPQQRRFVQYNVYNQPIDPTNQMPVTPNQQPWPGQSKLLSTDRVTSAIPKAGGTQWVFPSPQMFYNALMRKGKGADVTEDDMGTVVAVHNSMNEMTWQHVLVWERLHKAECGHPALLRFQGKPDVLSPRARVRKLFTGVEPFDRHDWFVDRCGTEVRYVIDFYHNEAAAGMDAFELDVRPALDSWTAVVDRTKMGIYLACKRMGVPCPITGARALADPAPA